MTKPGVIVAHSGGPTTVLNASLAGVIDASRELGGMVLYGARFGIRGLVTGDWLDLTGVDAGPIRSAPGSVLGSSREKLGEEDAHRLVDLLKSRGVGILLYTGGNGSMFTAERIVRIAASEHPDLRVIGVPKTVDNDLAVTDHSPGFGSAARFYAHAVRDIGLDNRALPSPVTIVEIIGRNAGWVTGATVLARGYEDDAPHLVYMPEAPPSLEKICDDVERVCRRTGRAVVAACEGLRDPAGQPFGADLDRPGSRQHELAQNLGLTLARAVSQRTGLRARSEKPGLLGRSCSLAVSATDAAEAYLCGAEAVRTGVRGETDVMVGLRRVSERPYRSETFPVPLREVVGVERVIPAAWIASSGNDVSPAFLEYVQPLAGEVPRHPRL